jgi:hypothetical protein
MRDEDGSEVHIFGQVFINQAPILISDPVSSSGSLIESKYKYGILWCDKRSSNVTNSKLRFVCVEAHGLTENPWKLRFLVKNSI